MKRFLKFLLMMICLCALSVPAALTASPPQTSQGLSEDIDWLGEDEDEDEDDDDDNDYEVEGEDEDDDDD